MIDFDLLIARLPSVRTLLIAGVAVLVVVLAGGGAWYWFAAKQSEAANAYAAALARSQAARSQQGAPQASAAAVRALESTLQAYPSAPMAAQAAYELAGLRWTQGQYAGARSAYEIALARAASPTMKTLARLGIGYAWEAEHNAAKAAETFQAVAAELKPSDAFYEQALLDLARTQELAGRKDDAVQTYRRVLKDASRGSRGDEVRMRLASLGVTP